jgi:hypothetical protein
MHKSGLAVAAMVPMIVVTLLASHAQAVTLGGSATLRTAMAAVDTSEPVFCYGCPGGDCGCGSPFYGYYYPRPYSYGNYCCQPPYYYERPRHFSYYHDPGPYRDPLDLNWGVHTRWANGFSQY